MSTGAECRFIETEPGRWAYELQQWPYGDNPNFEKHGPFRSFAAAMDHLEANHANPGGHSTTIHANHVHEFVTGPTTINEAVGVSVTINVQSLGPDPDRDAVIAFVKSLPADHPAWNVRPLNRWAERVVTQCEPCGATR